MKNTRIYDRVPVKDVRVKDPLIGTRTPQILISRKSGEYLRGDVLDANATTELAKSIHMPDIDKINEKLELTVNKDLIGLPNGVAGLDSTGNVPIDQLANISADLDTKANTSDVLLKKSASGGYYIEENSNELGLGAFAVNSFCTASGIGAHAEGGATASGIGAHAEGCATASGDYSHAEGELSATASGILAHAEGSATASGMLAHAEGGLTHAAGVASHAEGVSTLASGYCSHALGTYNVDDKNAIYSVGIGDVKTRKNAEYIYAKNNEDGGDLTDDPKNGYKYLIGVGGYDGISTDNTTYKSVQEVIADLTASIGTEENFIFTLEDGSTVTKSIRVISTTSQAGA